MKNVLSVQSSVVYGYAGNKAAVLPMQLSGIDVWPFYTVQFSNHTQYGMWQGMAMPHGELSAIISGLDVRVSRGQTPLRRGEARGHHHSPA